VKREQRSATTALLCLIVVMSAGCSLLPDQGEEAGESGPNPWIHLEVIHEDAEYGPTGVCSSHHVGVDITNDGQPGYVLVTAQLEDMEAYAQSFYVEQGETVTVWLRVSCFSVGLVSWTAEPTAEAGESDDRIRVERQD
jgi:hypothetical protein